LGLVGVYVEDIDLLDTILVDGSYTRGNFSENFNNEKVDFVRADSSLNSTIEYIANRENIKLKKANIACTECFDPYIEDAFKFVEKFPKEYDIVGAEMESFALFYTARILKKKAACLLTVVDSVINKKSLTSEQREKSLNDMIKLALETSLEI
jgi:purine-nucleoside phosphorylase